MKNLRNRLKHCKTFIKKIQVFVQKTGSYRPKKKKNASY